jgi:hypothetical protein
MAWVFTRYSSDYTSQERAAIGARLRRSPDGLVPKKDGRRFRRKQRPIARANRSVYWPAPRTMGLSISNGYTWVAEIWVLHRSVGKPACAFRHRESSLPQSGTPTARSAPRACRATGRTTPVRNSATRSLPCDPLLVIDGKRRRRRARSRHARTPAPPKRSGRKVDPLVQPLGQPPRERHCSLDLKDGQQCGGEKNRAASEPLPVGASRRPTGCRTRLLLGSSLHVMNALRQALLPESPSLRPLFGRHSWLGTGAAVAANSCPEMLIRGQGQALRHIDRTLPTHVVRERRQDHHGKSTNTDQSV